MSVHDIPVTTIDGRQTTLGEVTNGPALIVNVASRCGLTPQYEGLVALHQQYRDRGFTVLGFPCNQFKGQEPGTNEEIVEFCSTTYGVDFPLFDKLDVKGDGQHPLYAELSELPDDEGNAGDVIWNFEKFLVDGDGQPVARFRPQVQPDDPALTAAVDSLLA